MLDSPHVSPARRKATFWALEELERRMGVDWLERYWEVSGHVPYEVNLGSAHVSAFGNLLDFALRFTVLDGVSGVGKIQREMRRDLRDDRRRHCALQLEVGALAAREGYAVTFEDRFRPGVPPSDVVLRKDQQVLRVETFAIMPDKASQDADMFWQRISIGIKRIEWKYDTPIAGTIGQQLSDEESTELLRLLEHASQQVVTTNEMHHFSQLHAELRIQPPGCTDYGLQFGVEQSDSWPRITSKLCQKAEQAQASGGGWLRVELRDGTWAFTPWARAGLRAKIDEMERQVRSLLYQFPGISGVALSNGLGFAQGNFVGESARTGSDSYGIRRVLPPVRVRETMIVSVSEAGRQQARTWVDLYGGEASWLDWALDRLGLPAWSEIRP